MYTVWTSFFALHCLFLGAVNAILANRTIDDKNGDSVTGNMPRYNPPDFWNEGNGCVPCAIHPDPSEAYNSTWHDTQISPNTTTPRTITMTFNGTAIYVYCIVPNLFNGTAITTNITFTIDGQLSDRTFTYIGDNSTDLIYNVAVYTNDSLKNAEHTLILEATPGSYAASTVLFDYVEYTFDNNSGLPSTSSHSHGGVIAGGVIGTLAGLALVCSAAVYLRSSRRHNHDIRSSELGITAYNISAEPDHGLHTPERSMVTLTGKAALRQEDRDRLQHSTLTGDPHEQAIPTSTTSTSMAVTIPSTAAGTEGNTESGLAHQIAELRMEVADLRMRPSIVDDFPPPQYDHEMR